MIDVERRISPPPSLQAQKKYDGGDVREALHQDFLRKCYLCEEQVLLGGFQVEHRIPKANGGPKFQWDNLFPSCARCNGRRRRKKPPVGGLLSPGEGVEKRLVQRAIPSGIDLAFDFAAVDQTDSRAVNTAKELARIHELEAGEQTTENTEFALRDLQREIHDQYIGRVFPLELKVRRGRRDGDVDPSVEEELRRMLSRKARFTMLMRSLVDTSLSDLFD